jgi:hypothetical protein
MRFTILLLLHFGLFTTAVGGETWQLPRADDVLEVVHFPPGVFFEKPTYLDVKGSVIERFLLTGRILANSRKSEAIGLGLLTETSGTLQGKLSDVEGVRNRMVENGGSLYGLVENHGVILLKSGEIFFFELLNDRALVIFRDAGNAMFDDPNLALKILVLDN